MNNLGIVAICSMLILSSGCNSVKEAKSYGVQDESSVDLQIVENSKSWERVYYSSIGKGMLPKPQLPDIDFDKHNLLFVSLGQKSSAGYSVEYVESSAKIVDDELQLILNIETPKSGYSQAQMITDPNIVIQIPKHGYSSVVIYNQKNRVIVHKKR